MIIGALCGSLNGFLVGGLRLNPFIATLGTLMFFKGIKLVVSPSSIWATSLPEFYLTIGKSTLTTIIVFCLILVFLWFLFRYVRFGINIYAVGGNPQSAHMLGINIGRTYFFVYVLDGTLCGLASLFYSGYVHSVPINIAEGTMILAFAGAVIGGVSLRGGRGSVINAFWGILLLGFIESGLAMFAVSSEVRMASYGILVVTAVIIASFKDSLRDKILKPKLES
jgi:ribose/xylose/arabinose/galactoside ABC-type transport system permease subunit